MRAPRRRARAAATGLALTIALAFGATAATGSPHQVAGGGTRAPATVDNWSARLDETGSVFVSCQFGETMELTSGTLLARGTTIVTDRTFTVQGTGTWSNAKAVGLTTGTEYVFRNVTTQFYKLVPVTAEPVITMIQIHRVVTAKGGGGSARLTTQVQLLIKPTGEVVLLSETTEEDPPC